MVTGGLACAVQLKMIDELIIPTLSGTETSSLVSYGLSGGEQVVYQKKRLAITPSNAIEINGLVQLTCE